MTQWKRRVLVLIGAFLVGVPAWLSLTACHVCMAGEKHACVYLAGACKKATQVCNAEGTQWEPCVCQEPGLPSSSSPQR